MNKLQWNDLPPEGKEILLTLMPQYKWEEFFKDYTYNHSDRNNLIESWSKEKYPEVYEFIKDYKGLIFKYE